MTADARTAGSGIANPATQTAADLQQAAVRAADTTVGVTNPPALLESLRQLQFLRGIAIVGQAAAIALALAWGVALPVIPMALVIGALVAVNFVVSGRLKRGTSTTHLEVAAHLALDLAAFSALLILAGGTANPFALLYLLHVVLIAMLLPWRLAAVGTLLVVASFALAFVTAEPLRGAGDQPLSDTTMALGLWASFTLTAAVIAWFIVRIVATLRGHEQLLREAARRTLNDEAVMRIGTLAAGAAHELGTPLTTMAVVVGEMRREADTPTLAREAGILAAQVDACRRALDNLRAAAGHARVDDGGRERVDAFVASTVARFRALRPDVPLDADTDGPTPAPEIAVDPALAQALLILLNNAADASPDRVDLHARWDAHRLHVAVGDRGAGIPRGSLDKLGREFFTTKPPGKGTGLGLVLTASTVGRLGGTVRWTNRADGGLLAQVELPLTSLAPGRALP